ncbi:universal stress protein [Halomarina salina]|uniref:Universal stress protein n=1 Tax=Halomarina salina TaxID=1872699 RepID=A0ABD5RP87_9EURY|nr:universal stress protein [Halomarina salina]
MTHVLVPLDGSEGAEASLAYALDLFPEGRFTLLAVIDPTSGFSGAGAPGTSEVWYRNARTEATEHLDAARETVEERGAEVSSVVETGRPARLIVEYADEHDVDHVVMGTHSREGVSRLLTGSVAEGVVRHATVPVTVVR